MKFYLEGPGGISGIKQSTDIRTAKNFTFEGNLTVLGTLSAASESITSELITTANANAFAVGANGLTNPAFNVDTSAASVATGVNIAGAAAGSGVTLSALSSNASENLILAAKGAAGVLQLQGTNGITLNSATAITSTSPNAFAVGRAGTTNPVLNVNAGTSSAATGLNITGAAAGGGLAISVITSGTNENLKLDSASAGSIAIGSISTGPLLLGIGAKKALYIGATLTALGSVQNTTPTGAQIAGGFLSHASTTGGGTATLDTATGINNAFGGITSTNYSFTCVYANIGSQTVTITTNTGLTLVGTVAIPAGKNAILSFYSTGSNTFNVYCTVSA